MSFPAASSILTSPRGYGLSETRYGAMFLPQVIFAILASAGGPALARRRGLKQAFVLGLVLDLAAMVLLATSQLLVSAPAVAYGTLLVATGALGGGFGVTVMALNTYAQEYFPAAPDRAVLAMNVLLGVGTTVGPVLVAIFLGLHAWWLLPVVVAAGLAGLIGMSLPLPLAAGAPRGTDPARRTAPPVGAGRSLPRRFWLYAGVALLYGIFETLCGNWSTLYLIRERHVAAQWAALALTAFWAMMTLGRVAVALVSPKVSPRYLYPAHPVLMAVASIAVFRATTGIAGVAAFGFAGLACSAFLPLTISTAGGEFPGLTAVVSGQLIAFYQVGYGIAAFGVGPVRAAIGVPLSTIYAGAAAVAVAMTVLALPIGVRRTGGG